MAVKNSFVSLANQIEKLNKNSNAIIATLNEVVTSNDNQVTTILTDDKDQPQTLAFPTVGFLSSEIERLNQNLNTISSVDQRGAIIQPARNEFAKIIRTDLNREPNPIPELDTVNSFLAEKNWFFDSLLNPMIRVRLDLSGKIENNVRKILSRRYIIKFELNEDGTPTEQGQTATDNFNETFKNRTNVSIDEIETWLKNTPGIAVNNRGSKINCDEQEFELEANKLQYEGFFTILGVDEDTVNQKQWFLFDTLDYFEIDTKQKRQLQLGNELIINTDFSTTRYKIIEINNEASEIRIRMERVEGLEPIPVGIQGGMKFYSPIVETKNVDISIGYNEYNVVFTKAINTENYLIGREWSLGVAFYSNDLTLNSTNDNGENGQSMQEFYISTVRDFGELLKDLVERSIPRISGVKPDAPVLTTENFRVLQDNKFLTDTPSLEEARRSHQKIRELRSKIDQTNKTIQEKNKELQGKRFRSPKDRLDVENQIKKLSEQAQSDSELLNTTVNELLANNSNNTTVDPSFKAQGFWQTPNPKESFKTKLQEVIAFKVQYKYSNVDGKEAENETFKVIDEDGNETNAVFSPWTQYITDVRERSFDINTQKFVWVQENLGSIDEPNINSINLPLNPDEQITMRVKSISEVGYPDSLLESDWSNEITISFPEELIAGRNPQEQFLKNAELEDLRNRIQGDLDRQGLSQHLSDGVTFENKYFPHNTDNVGFKDANGKIIDLSAKIKLLESADPVEKYTDIPLLAPWANYGNWGGARYYKHEGRVYLSGLIRVDKGSDFKTFSQRFPQQEIRIQGRNRLNPNLSRVAFLPEGYRPDARTLDISSTYGGRGGIVTSARIDILPNGLIMIVNANTGWLSLDGISFRVSG